MQRLRKAGELMPVGIPLEGADTTRCMQCGVRTFAEGSTRGTIWSGSQHLYVLEQHDLQGKLLRRIVRDAPWYPKWPEEAAMPAGMEEHAFGPAIDSGDWMLKELSKSRLFALSQDSDGILWAFTASPDPERPLPAAADLAKMMDSGDDILESFFVTVIEAYDAERGVLLSSTRMRGQVHPLGSGLVSRVVPDELTGKSHRILRLSVRGYTKQGG
jgi:hypothetical protein